MAEGSRPRRGGGVRLDKVVDLEFVKSVPGILLAVQAVCSLLALILAGSWQGSYTGSHTFFLLVMAPSFFASLSLLISRAIGLDELLNKQIPWDILLAGHSALGFVFVLIASCLMVEAAQAVSALKAAGVFGLFAWNSLLVGVAVHGRPVLRQLRGGGGLSPQTATVSSRRSQDPEAQNDDSDSGDEWSDDEASMQGGDGGVTFVGQRSRPLSTVEVSNVAPASPRAKRMSAVYDPTTGMWAPAPAPPSSWAPPPAPPYAPPPAPASGPVHKWAPDPAPTPVTSQTWSPAPAPADPWDTDAPPTSTEASVPAFQQMEAGAPEAAEPASVENGSSAEPPVP